MADLVSHALTSVNDVKESLGIESGNTSKDNLIKRKINAATAMIEKYCNFDKDHHFALTDYTDEEYDGTGIDQLVLRVSPIFIGTTEAEAEKSFTLYVRNSTLNEDSWDTIDSETYFVDKLAGVIDAKFIFLKQWNHYKVDYTGGFENIPADLAEACVALAAFLVDNGAQGTGVKRKKEGQREIEYHAPSNMSDKSLIKQLNLDETLDAYVRYSLQDDK